MEERFALSTSPKQTSSQNWQSFPCHVKPLSHGMSTCSIRVSSTSSLTHPHKSRTNGKISLIFEDVIYNPLWWNFDLTIGNPFKYCDGYGNTGSRQLNEGTEQCGENDSICLLSNGVTCATSPCDYDQYEFDDGTSNPLGTCCPGEKSFVMVCAKRNHCAAPKRMMGTAVALSRDMNTVHRRRRVTCVSLEWTSMATSWFATTSHNVQLGHTT